MFDPQRTLATGRVVVLGAGIAGLAAADTLARAGYRVKIVEADDRCGGMHRSSEIGPYTFDIGSIFYEEKARLFDLAPGLRDACPQVLSVQRRIAPDGSILVYPIEPRDLARHPAWRLSLAALDLLASRATVRRDGTLDAICRKRLGRRFYEMTGLKSYIGRFHHVAPDELEEEFFFRRMAIIERATRLDSLCRAALQSFLPGEPANARLKWPMRVRPRGGFAAIFDPIVRRLTALGVEFHLGHKVRSIACGDWGYSVVAGPTTFTADAVISTIPLDTLHLALCGESSGLRSLDMTTLYVSAGAFAAQSANVLFNFHGEGLWKRLTLYSRIYPDPGAPREFFSVEVTIPPGGRHDPGAAFRDFAAHVTRLGLASDLRLEGARKVEGCYPLYTVGSSARLQGVLRRIERSGVILAGRQGRFEYLPTSSRVIARVVAELGAADLPALASKAAA